MIKKLLIAATLLIMGNQADAQCTATITGNSLACYGDTSVLQATPGGVSYQWYAWNQPIAGATNSQYVCSLSQDLTVIIDFGSCTDTSAIFQHVANPIFYVSYNTNTTFCDGDSIGLYAGPAGGTPPYSSICTGPAGYLSFFPNIIIPVSQVANSGDYIMTITDGVGCIAQDTIVITVDSIASPIVANMVYCVNEIAGPLTGTGSNLLWYTTQVGGTGLTGVVPSTMVPGTTSYYVSQTVNGCESQRAPQYTTVVVCDSVWPGDVNYDLTADNNDVLDLALAYGHTGGIRTGASNSWVAQYCADWGIPQIGGPDMKHADCNGDGLVDINDTTAISQNYGQVHLKGLHIPQAKSAADPDLYFDLTGISFTAGTLVSVPIKFGTTSLPMNNIMGIAADVKVNGVTLTVAPTISATTSWLGNSLNTMNFTKGVSNNQADWTLTRIDHNNASGNGTIAMLNIQIPTGFDGQNVVLYFDDVKVIDNAGNVITNYNVVDDTATIVPVSVNTANSAEQYATVVPNPSGAQAALHLSLAKAASVEVTVTDVTGRKVWSRKQNAAAGIQSVMLPADIASGLYNVQVSNGDGTVGENLKWIKK